MATIYKRGRIWWVAYKDRNGRRKQESTGLGDRKAAEALKRHYGALEKSYCLEGTPLQTPLRLSGWRKEYADRRSGRVAKKTLARDRNALDSLQAVVGDPYLSDVGPADIERWYSAVLKTRTTATANCLYRHLKTFFSTAVKEKFIRETPCALRPVRETSRVIRVLSEAEAEKILSGLPPHWRNIAAAALYTGARAGELCRMEIADVDLSRPAVTIRSTPENPTKNRQSRVVPLPLGSVDFFSGLMEGRRPRSPLLVNASETAWNVMWLAKGFTKWMRRIGVSCSFHDLRRTYGAWLVMKGADLVTVQQNLGHSDISVTVKHYAHMVMNHRAEQVNRLPRLL
ncbi:MAG: tyrosine-type recombinase/integrase [Desulfococcaceae bacterium]